MVSNGPVLLPCGKGDIHNFFATQKRFKIRMIDRCMCGAGVGVETTNATVIKDMHFSVKRISCNLNFRQQETHGKLAFQAFACFVCRRNC